MLFQKILGMLLQRRNCILNKGVKYHHAQPANLFFFWPFIEIIFRLSRSDFLSYNVIIFTRILSRLFIPFFLFFFSFLFAIM